MVAQPRTRLLSIVKRDAASGRTWSVAWSPWSASAAWLGPRSGWIRRSSTETKQDRQEHDRQDDQKGE
jgi:hypothetical protein